MPDLPPDLSRLGDALEHAVGRAIARRRAQLRAAWALGAVVAAMPMAMVLANLYVRAGDGPLQSAPSVHAVPSTTTDDVVGPAPERTAKSQPAGVRDRGTTRSPHPLDDMPPPVDAEAARDYDPGVATERVDRRPPFVVTPI